MYHFQLSLENTIWFLLGLFNSKSWWIWKKSAQDQLFHLMVIWCPIGTVEFAAGDNTTVFQNWCCLDCGSSLRAFHQPDGIFFTFDISNTMGSIRLYTLEGRAVHTATWMYYKTPLLLGPPQSWQHFMSHRMSHIILHCGICCLCDLKRPFRHWSSFFMVGSASARSSNVSCTLKGMFAILACARALDPKILLSWTLKTVSLPPGVHVF